MKKVDVKMHSGAMESFNGVDRIYSMAGVITIRSEDSILAIFQEDDVKQLLSNGSEENRIETPLTLLANPGGNPRPTDRKPMIYKKSRS